jgi:hypothetical protein
VYPSRVMRDAVTTTSARSPAPDAPAVCAVAELAKMTAAAPEKNALLDFINPPSADMIRRNEPQEPKVVPSPLCTPQPGSPTSHGARNDAALQYFGLTTFERWNGQFAHRICRRQLQNVAAAVAAGSARLTGAGAAGLESGLVRAFWSDHCCQSVAGDVNLACGPIARRHRVCR